MEFGIYLNQYGDRRADFTYRDMFEQARLMEELDYDVAAVGERHFYEDGFFDPFTCLSALAARTEDLDIMANILILPIYHPIHLAEKITNIDHLSGGDTRWGVSLGYRTSELTNFGVSMEDRVSRFLENLTLTKRLLEGERFDYEGEFYQFEDAFVSPQPQQEPRPKFWGGGNADAAIRRAAKECDGFTAAVTVPEELEGDIQLYYDALEESGKSPSEGHVTIMIDGYVAETTRQAREELTPNMIDLVTKYIKWGNPEFEGRPDWEDVQDQLLYGTPDEVAEKVERFRDMGVDHLIFRTQFPGMTQGQALDSIRRFGVEVIPRFD